MATKKTPKSGKTAPAKNTAPATAAVNEADRPTALCPFPDHLQVDLESAETEWMKSQVPASAPLPVFSTRALEHGMKAAGAAGLRKGFSWNNQMDLAWALGYPKMTFIVDGILEGDSREDVLKFYGKDLSYFDNNYWFSQITGAYKHLVPRRAAFALLYETEHEEHPFDLSEKEFLKATEPRDLSVEEVSSLLKKVEVSSLEEMALILEALAGSSMVATVLCEVLEERASDEGENGRFRSEIRALLLAVCRRLPQNEANAMLKRGAPDARALGADALSRGRTALALARLQWVDGVEDDVLHAFVEESREGVGDVPFPRYLYAGGDELMNAQIALFEKYMDGPLVFFEQYSTIQHALSTGPALLTRKEKKFREAMTLWFQKHADFYRPLLTDLKNDPNLGKHASDMLKKLG